MYHVYCAHTHVRAREHTHTLGLFIYNYYNMGWFVRECNISGPCACRWNIYPASVKLIS